MLYLKSFLIAFFVSIVLTFFIKKFAFRFKIFSRPSLRRIHQKNIPLLGGAAMISAFVLAVFLTKELVISFQLCGLLIGLGIIFFVGIWDDLREISWKVQLSFQILIALIIIAFGVRIDYLTNPFGGIIRLDQIEFSIYNFFAFDGFIIDRHFSLFGSLFIIFWIVLMINIFNWLDGIDGLASGIGIIGGIVLFFLCLNPVVNQPPLAILAIALVGSSLGFLFFNFPPAKIFMGTSGSMFLGFTLGVLAIFSGAKIATALLVLGFPILDGFWVIGQRIKNKNSPFQGDQRHLHYKLLSLKFSPRQIILLIYSLCALFGFVALFIQGIGKLIALIILGFLMLFIGLILTWLLAKKQSNSSKN